MRERGEGPRRGRQGDEEREIKGDRYITEGERVVRVVHTEGTGHVCVRRGRHDRKREEDGAQGTPGTEN